jgi:hypothetical protein
MCSKWQMELEEEIFMAITCRPDRAPEHPDPIQ